MLGDKRLVSFVVGGGAVCSALGLAAIWRDWRRRNMKQFEEAPKNLEGGVYLVTGANSGIGKAIAWDLAKRKAKVFMLCRDMHKCETSRKEIVLSTRNKFVYCRPCDLSSQSSIRKFVQQFREEQQQHQQQQQPEFRVDCLINNAGIMQAPRSFSREGVEIHFATNHLGHFLLTYLLLGGLQHKGIPGSGRVVFLVNLDYRKAETTSLLEDPNFSNRVYDKADAFNQSQLANMLLVEELSRRLRPSGVSVYAAYPGVVNTAIKRHMGVDKSISGNVITKPLLWAVTKSTEEGAKTPLYLAIGGPGPEATGKLFSNLKEKEIDPVALDESAAKKLWAIDEYWTGLRTKSEILSESQVERG